MDKKKKSKAAVALQTEYVHQRIILNEENNKFNPVESTVKTTVYLLLLDLPLFLKAIALL